jgi:hypothetical protein
MEVSCMRTHTTALLAAAACAAALGACGLPSSVQPTAVSPGEPVVRQTPPPLAPTGIPLQDDFSDPRSGWEIGDYQEGDVGYGAGYYYVRAESQNNVMWGLALVEASDVIIEVDATQVEAPANDNNGYGLMCRCMEEPGQGDSYVFLIGGDGYYTIQYSSGGSYAPLVDWTQSAAIHQGDATNHIRVACVGTSLALYANGTLLAEVDDSRYASGDIALAAIAFETTPTEVRFDNVVVQAP